MKRFLSLLILLIAVSVSSYAQDGLYFAPKIGFGMSNYNGSVKSVFKGAITAGAAVGYDMSKLAVEASVMYRTADAGIDIDDQTQATLKSKYISIPVVAKLSLIGPLHIYAGPQFDFLVGEKLKLSDLKKDSDMLKSKTVSGVAGVGVSLPLNLGVDLNYNFGFSEATTQSIIDGFTEDLNGLKSQNISVILSYKF